MRIRSKGINPSRFPFFYGYVITFVGTLGVLFSLPGQTIGVSVFTGPVSDALGLSMNQFSAAYMVGTLASSFLISAAGRWFDRWGARVVSAFASLVLACSLFIASVVDVISSSIQAAFSLSHWLVPFLLMVFIFFLFRFSGQGVLTMASRNMVMKWFIRYRGRANAFKSLSISFGFSFSPILLDWLISDYQWQGAWRLMGFALLAMTLIVILFFRDNPEAFGLKPDGKPKKGKSNKSFVSTDSPTFEPKQAFTTRAYWMYSSILSFSSFFATGFTFHVVSIFMASGYERSQAISIFVPITFIAVAFSLLFNFISDRIQLKKILYIMILGGGFASIGLIWLSSAWGLVLIILGLGMLSGLFSVLNAVTWPQLFGRMHIGAISGRTMAMIVMASALAPMLFSLSYSKLNSFAWVGLLSVVFIVFVAVASLKANNPRLG